MGDTENLPFDVSPSDEPVYSNLDVSSLEDRPVYTLDRSLIPRKRFPLIGKILVGSTIGIALTSGLVVLIILLTRKSMIHFIYLI